MYYIAKININLCSNFRGKIVSLTSYQNYSESRVERSDLSTMRARVEVV